MERFDCTGNDVDIHFDVAQNILSQTMYGWRLACSKRSDSGERCEVKKAMKSRGGLSPSLAFIFLRSFLLRTASHYLNAWNRLGWRSAVRSFRLTRYDL